MTWTRHNPAFATGFFLAAFLAIGSASAGTVEPWFDASLARPTIAVDVVPTGFDELWVVLSSHFVNSNTFVAVPKASAVLLQIALLLSGFIYCLRHGPNVRDYRSLLAFIARSRTRWIIARNPLERWADRWSLRPSRPSSLAASTFNTSETAKPS